MSAWRFVKEEVLEVIEALKDVGKEGTDASLRSIDRMTEIVQKAGQARMVALENRALRNDLSSGDAAMRRLIG